mgnify:CR=1 FL=1
MSIKSYLAYPQTGRKEKLIAALSKMKHCELLPSENKDVIILITDTETKAQDEQINSQLEALDSLKLLTLVSGFNTAENDE